MTRIEENKMLIDKMVEEAERKPTGTYEEMVTFQLGTIATMLADISRSLAVIADKQESEE
jgi:6-phosphogluconate dehydrogenase